MSLKELIVATKPREVAGSRSANRFDFQKSWGLCRLLDLHQIGEDYLIVFDYHDDILVLDSATNPTQIDFYQIKTKQSSHWTRTALLSRESGKDGKLPSILGKLTHNKITFPEHTGKLTLVSTQGFKLAVKGSAASVVQEVCLKQLDDKELSAIQKSIREEHGLAKDLDCKDCTHLTVTSLSLGDHSAHAMGILGTFLEKLYPGEKVQLPAIYRALSDEIKRKTNVEKPPADFSQLCANRSISRAAFQQILADVKPAGQFDAAVKEATTQMQHEDFPFDEVRAIRLACTTYEVERMNSSDLVLGKARRSIENAVRLLREGQVPPKLSEAVSAIRSAVINETKVLVSVRSEHYRTAMILMALYGI